MIKKYAPYVAIAAGLLCIFLVVQNSIITDRYSRLKGEYAANVATATANEKAAAIQINALNETIRLKDTAIAAANERIRTITAAGAQAADQLSGLESEYKALIAAGGDKDSIIANQAKQIDVWRARFSLAESASAEKDKIIFGLQEKYALLGSISGEWESQFKAERQLRFDADALIKSLEWKVRICRAKNTIVTLAALAVGGYVLYDKLKGK